MKRALGGMAVALMVLGACSSDSSDTGALAPEASVEGTSTDASLEGSDIEDVNERAGSIIEAERDRPENTDEDAPDTGFIIVFNLEDMRSKMDSTEALATADPLDLDSVVGELEDVIEGYIELSFVIGGVGESYSADVQRDLSLTATRFQTLIDGLPELTGKEPSQTQELVGETITMLEDALTDTREELQGPVQENLAVLKALSARLPAAPATDETTETTVG